MQQLLAAGKAYRCYCTSEELEAKREKALEGRQTQVRRHLPESDRRRTPTGPTSSASRPRRTVITAFNDLIKGPISFNNEELDDLIIQRTDGTPTYNFVVVVDDASMGITTVIRGDDHINNTPRQILLYEALGSAGAEIRPCADDPRRRQDPSLQAPRRHQCHGLPRHGLLPEAMVNYLVRLGWSCGDEEIFSGTS